MPREKPRRGGRGERKEKEQEEKEEAFCVCTAGHLAHTLPLLIPLSGHHGFHHQGSSVTPFRELRLWLQVAQLMNCDVSCLLFVLSPFRG